MFLPLNMALPDVIKFEVTISYKDANGESIIRKIPVKYDSNQNYRSYGR